MLTERPSLHDWQELIRAEYEELPDLQLTQSQVEVLWTLDSVSAEKILAALVKNGFLKFTRRGKYVRATASL
jgi:hypothetical protein